MAFGSYIPTFLIPGAAFSELVVVVEQLDVSFGGLNLLHTPPELRLVPGPPDGTSPFQRPLEENVASHRIIPWELLNQEGTRNRTLVEWCLVCYGWGFFYPMTLLPRGISLKDEREIPRKLFSAARTTTDDSGWNVVMLDDSTPRNFWARGFCGFKCLGAERIPDNGMMRITLKFHWMPVIKPEAA